VTKTSRCRRSPPTWTARPHACCVCPCRPRNGCTAVPEAVAGHRHLWTFQTGSHRGDDRGHRRSPATMCGPAPPRPSLDDGTGRDTFVSPRSHRRWRRWRRWPSQTSRTDQTGVPTVVMRADSLMTTIAEPCRLVHTPAHRGGPIEREAQWTTTAIVAVHWLPHTAPSEASDLKTSLTFSPACLTLAPAWSFLPSASSCSPSVALPKPSLALPPSSIYGYRINATRRPAREWAHRRAATERCRHLASPSLRTLPDPASSR
jgi:hypothetical protein